MLAIKSSELSKEELVDLFGYQPFRLPDGTITGAGLHMLTGTATRALHPDQSSREWRRFRAASENQVQMYEDILSGIERYGGSLKGRSYADICCNAGYFCFRAMELGASSAVGVDRTDFGPAFAVVNHDRGIDARFVRAPYDMMAHRFDGLADDFQADVVTNIAFMCHDSDPTHLLAALASLAREVLVVYSRVIRSDKYIIEYSPHTNRWFDTSFPACFDFETKISDGLLKFGLKELGFSKVTEIPRKRYWVPSHREWRGFVAVR